MRQLAAFAFLVLSTSPAAAQTPEQPETFEVATLKPSAPGTRFGMKLDQAQFTCTGVNLFILAMSAWPEIEAQPWKLSGGPAWLNVDAWDLSAKLPPNMPADEKQLNSRTEQMLRNFLADEFKLQTHRETRDFPVYALVPARNGPKLKPSEASQFNVKYGRGRLEFRHQSMSGLANHLYSARAYAQQAADRPVIDRTGLDGFYDFTLEWTPDTPQPDPAASGPSIYTALEQQLGLRLQPEKAPIEFLVIDHAEKPAATR